jgi:hypothetical protein
VHRDSVGWHVTLGVDVAMKRAPGRRVVDQLDGAKLDDAMSVCIGRAEWLSCNTRLKNV